MICQQCNKENAEENKFCNYCGATLDKDKDFKQYDNIGGWLIVLGILIVWSPLVILGQIHEASKILKNEVLLPTVDQYINTIVAIDWVLFFMVFILAYIFFTKRIYFPRIFIGFIILNIVIKLLVLVMVSSLDIDNEYKAIIFTESINLIVANILMAAIWIPYMLISKRVKGTFTK